MQQLRANDWVAWASRHDRALLVATVVLAALVRYAALHVLHEPLESDAASYFEMARTILAPGPMRDSYGNAAFYSPGYPFALTLAFLVDGVQVAAAQWLNLLLGLASVLLIHQLTWRVTDDRLAALLAAAGFALLVPAVAGTAFVQRENLSVPLLLAFAIAAVALLTTNRPRLCAAAAGLAYGAGVLAGASVILTALAVPLALLWRRRSHRETATALAAFALAAAVPVLPWLLHVDSQLGRPTLSTNAPFNLYVGNNPAATGRFVSMRDTPIGPAWQDMRARLGELAATDRLGDEAKAYILGHPVEIASLALYKLALFWTPDVPDSTDTGYGTAVGALRWLEVVQHMILVTLGIAALLGWRNRSPAERLILLTVGLFWAVHAAAYVMPRYRLPAMPLVLVVGAALVAPVLRRQSLVRLRTAQA